jgi:hypothetical protein
MSVAYLDLLQLRVFVILEIGHLLFESLALGHRLLLLGLRLLNRLAEL